VYNGSVAPDRAHDSWLLSVVQEDGGPRLHIQAGAGMCAIFPAGLTFTVAGPEGGVTYAVVAGKQVQVKGGSLRASADCVQREADGVSLCLCGNVHLHWERGGGNVEVKARRADINLQSGRVALEFDSPQTNVSLPANTGYYSSSQGTPHADHAKP